MIALDTNILVYAHRELAPQYGEAFAAISDAANQPNGWGIPLPCVAEMWSIVTNPKHPGATSSSAQITSFIHYILVEGGGYIWTPGPGFGERLMRWAASLKVRGKRMFDLQIAVIAMEFGATEIWTFDRNFTSVPGLRVKRL